MRVFISSPGDVTSERRRAALVVQALAKEYARFFEIRLESWDSEPMLASGHFQDNIIPPSETDIVAVILWSRLGTPLPAKTEVREYHGIDGRVPVTGTEWEFEDALAAHRRNPDGIPDLLVYFKKAPPTATFTSDADLVRLGEQWTKLQAFWSRYFVRQGEFLAAFTEFRAPDEFERRFENDLRRLIERRIAISSQVRRTWLKEPFLGLSAYSFDDAPIFFGRREVTTVAVERLSKSADEGRAFLLILGASGSGKSSLAQAGIVPALFQRGVIPSVALWRRAVMRPGADRSALFTVLAHALVQEHALPELIDGGQDEKGLAAHLAASAGEPAYPVVMALGAIERKARERGDLLEVETARLVLVVDQLEELFSSSEIVPDERARFVQCLDGLARSGRVFVIATMRSDYWHRAAETPLLVEAADERRRIDVLPPSRSEIGEMISRPARAAGVVFERDARKDVGLDDELADEAAQEPGSLPLLSFLLNALYHHDIAWPERSTLTYASTNALGGLRGAIAQRADEVFAALPDDARAALPKVLRALVMVSRSNAAATARAAPLAAFPAGSPERRLVEALLEARLLISRGDPTGPQIRLAHEALISHWGLARAQIERDREDLRTRDDVELAESKYASAGANKRAYLLHDPDLAKAVDLLRRWGGDLPQSQRAFIERSAATARAAARKTIVSLSATAAILFALATFSFVEWRSAALHNDAYALYNAAAIQSELGNRPEAYGLYQRALVLFTRLRDRPREADTTYRIGLLLKRSGKPQPAREALHRALALHLALGTRGETIYDYMSLSDADILARLPKVAIDDAKSGLKLAPRNAGLLTNLAHGYLFSGDVKQAERLYFQHAADDGFTFGDGVLRDFKRYRALGLDSPDIAQVERKLKALRAGS